MKHFNELNAEQLLNANEFEFAPEDSIESAATKLIEKFSDFKPYRTELTEIINDSFYETITAIVVKDKCFKLTYNEDYVVMATVEVTHK